MNAYFAQENMFYHESVKINGFFRSFVTFESKAEDKKSNMIVIFENGKLITIGR